jgi:hypothetical protein
MRLAMRHFVSLAGWRGSIGRKTGFPSGEHV